MTAPVLSPDIQRQITELRATRPYDGRRVTLHELRGLAADRCHMVLVVEHDPDNYWPVGMELLAELDHESVPVFSSGEGN